MAEFYAPEASVFGSSATRPEPGRLAAARRHREYFNKETTIRAQVGSVDVQVLSDRLALAAYTFTFHASRVAVGISKSQEEDIRHGRATQLFQLEHDGRLLIVHEHLSAVD